MLLVSVTAFSFSNLGLVPALNKNMGKDKWPLPNESTRYTTGWFDLKITSDTPWLSGIKEISLPIAHGEGKFLQIKKF